MGETERQTDREMDRQTDRRRDSQVGEVVEDNFDELLREIQFHRDQRINCFATISIISSGALKSDQPEMI